MAKIRCEITSKSWNKAQVSFKDEKGEISSFVVKRITILGRIVRWFKSFFPNRLTQKFVKVEGDHGSLEIKISDLAKEVGLTASEILHCKSLKKKLSDSYPVSVAKEEIHKITQKDINIMSQLKQLAQALINNPPKKEGDYYITVTEKIRLLVNVKGTDVKVSTLFGRKVAKGSFNVVMQSTDLLTGLPVKGESAIVKSTYNTSNRGEIDREVAILNHLHGSGEVLGIQKKVRKIIDVVTGQESACHVGVRYKSDLYDFPIQKVEDKVSIAYQLTHAVVYAHSKGIAHRDIKPENIFVGETSEEGGPLVYLADFGGSVDFSEKDAFIKRVTTTPEFSTGQDESELNLNVRVEKFDAVKEIHKKADVYSVSWVLIEIFTPVKASETPLNITRYIESQLKKSGLNDGVIRLILKGIDKDYRNRPSMEELHQAVTKELERILPTRAASLKELSA
ncbi:MAG: hypothetical protein S4CHLAM45_13780 [Chlamydiales bacterium]|nr:hypothetical protein [Chlamydiales bacterium]MCH9620483.1 hypothetical protein [Chlamydiales bacterium]MCH9623468.1 hypothetical protein [Chlamydiales bacterium]